MANDILLQERNIHPDVLPIKFILTYGAGNVSMGWLPPREEDRRFASQIAEGDFFSVVINMEHATFDQGLDQSLAEKLKAPFYSLPELKVKDLFKTVSSVRQTVREENR